MIEETLAALLDARLAPLQAEVQRLAAEVAGLRRSLPPMLVSLPEAARALGVSLSTIRRRARDGSLPVRRVGRLIRVDLAAIRPLTGEEVAREARRLRGIEPSR